METKLNHVSIYHGGIDTNNDGNYTEYEKWRKAKLGADATPKRMKYKKIGG